MASPQGELSALSECCFAAFNEKLYGADDIRNIEFTAFAYERINVLRAVAYRAGVIW